MSDSEESKNGRPEDGLTRRDLIRAVGLSAGGVALGLSTAGTGSIATAADKGRAYAVGNVALEIDGTATYLKSAAGGNAIVDVVLEPSGDGIQRKRPGAITFDDLVLEVPFAMSPVLANWISTSLASGPVLKSGAVVYLDHDLKEVKRLEFFNAAITEVTLPALDAMGKEQLSLIIHITPEMARMAGGGKPSSVTVGKSSAKLLLNSGFTFNVQGLEAAAPATSKVSMLTAKRAPQAGDGSQRMKERQFGPLDCSVVTITVAENAAGPFYAWLNDLLVNGKAIERAGRLELKQAATGAVVAFVDLGNLGIVRFAPAATSGTDTLPRVEVDMYCESINLSIV